MSFRRTLFVPTERGADLVAKVERVAPRDARGEAVVHGVVAEGVARRGEVAGRPDGVEVHIVGRGIVEGVVPERDVVGPRAHARKRRGGRRGRVAGRADGWP